MLSDIFDSSISPSLSIYDVPSLSHNEELLSNLLEQDQHSRSAESHFDFRRLDFPGVRGGFSASHIVRWMFVRLSKDTDGASEP